MYEDQKILVVEDNPADVFLLREVFNLEKINSSIDICNDGVEALDYLKKAVRENTEINLIILDINMPRLNGLEFLKEASQLSLLSDTPIMMLSTTSDFKEIEKCYQLGASIFFVKPMNLNEYSNIINFVKSALTKKFVSDDYKFNNKNKPFSYF